MIELLFGQRQVGTIRETGGTGLGKILWDHGFDSVFDERHHSKDDPDFFEAVKREFFGEYFKAVDA